MADDNNTHDPSSLKATLLRLHLTRRNLRRGMFAFGAACGILLLSCAAYIAYLIPGTPDIDHLQQARDIRPSILLAADGRQLAAFKQVQQEWVGLDRISPHMIEALVATEDHRFYRHHGIDVGRTVAALFHTIGGDAQGGSTITQQLARNMFPEEIGHARTINRKLKEIITAIRIEQHYSKQEILETYLNTTPFLYNAVGIEMAAQTYYGKHASDLGVLESATLAGMLKGTHYYNPVANPERAYQRRNIVLGQMRKYGTLSEQDFQSFRTQPLQLHFKRQQEQQDALAPHFVAYVRKWLADWAERNGHDFLVDGLTVQTTLDLTLQEEAMRAVTRQANQLQDIADVEWAQGSASLLPGGPGAYARMHKHVEPFRYFWNANPDLVDAFIRDTPEFRQGVNAGQNETAAIAALKTDSQFIAQLRAAKTRLEAGFVAIDPATGEVKAWVGSRDFAIDQFDHVAQAARQPGSTFKPIVYGAALEQGMRTDRAYRDEPVTIRSADGGVWRPTDMSAASGEWMTLRDGLIYSKNTITAQVMQDVGLPRIVSLARAMGITRSPLDEVPSLALGTSPVTLLEMVSAYSTIAANGEYRPPVFVKKITDRNGKVLAEFGAQSRLVMSRSTAVDLIDMLRGAVSRGTGQMVKTQFGIAADIAGKTGTTQNNTDGWFILMHPNLVAGAWVGFNDARVTMRSNYWGQGGHNAILVVGDFFRDALKERRIDAKAQFPQPVVEPLMIAASPDDELRRAESMTTGELLEHPPAGFGVIVRSDGSRIIIGAVSNPPENSSANVPASGVTVLGQRGDGSSAGKTSAELADAMRGMGRDPVTGERVESSGDSGAAQASDGGTANDENRRP